MVEATGKPLELINWLYSQDKDKLYEIKEHKETRGVQANKYFHSLINQLARFNRSSGHAISDDEMKREINTTYGTLAKADDGQVLGAKVPKGTDMYNFYPYAKWYKSEDNCDCYLFYKRTHELDSKEFYQLIKGLEAECRNVGIKTLDDIEFEEMMKTYDEEKNGKRKGKRV